MSLPKYLLCIFKNDENIKQTNKQTNFQISPLIVKEKYC